MVRAAPRASAGRRIVSRYVGVENMCAANPSATSPAIAERRRTEAAAIIEAHCLDQLGVAVLDDLAERVGLWRAHADVIGLTVPWYGLDRDAQIALFRDVLRALRAL